MYIGELNDKVVDAISQNKQARRAFGNSRVELVVAYCARSQVIAGVPVASVLGKDGLSEGVSLAAVLILCLQERQ